LHFLRCGDARAAFDYSLHYANRIHLLKVGYDPTFAAYSPSNLLLNQVLERAFDEGAEEYDFLGECADWKLRWTPLSKPHCWLFVFSNSAKGRALDFAKFRLVPLWKSWNARLRDGR
jgi:CelD/BcsL family acetyltransferase involved in cellulose biosynthesis